MTHQPSLLDPDLAPSHHYDGLESRQAAAKVDAQRQYELVLRTLYLAGTALTDDSIAERAGLLRHSAGTRRGVAVKRQHVVRAGTGKSALGNTAALWKLSDAGREFVEGMTQ